MSRKLSRAKQIAVVILAFLIAFSGLGTTVERGYAAPPGEDRPPFYTDGSVFTRQPDTNVTAFRIPSIVVTNAGTALVFTEGRIESFGDAAPSHIVMKRSEDNGEVWSDMQIIVPADAGQSWSNPVPVVERATGKIILFYALNEENNETKVYFKTSTDDGRTWSEATDISYLFEDDPFGRSFHLPGPGHGIQLQDGRLMTIVWHRHDVNRPQHERAYGASVIYSDDGGVSWKTGGFLAVDEEVMTDESRILELEDGTIVMNSRTVTQDRRLISTSSDRGETWTRPVVDETIASYGSVDTGFIRYPEAGNDVLLLSRPNSSAREKLTVDISYDGGASWAHSKLLYGGPAAYSDMAVLHDGTILIVYERSPFGAGNPYRSLDYARFNREWVAYPAFPPMLTQYEAENLTISESSGNAVTFQDNNAHSGRRVLIYQAASIGDYVQFELPVASPGTYRIELSIRRANRDRGQMQVSMNGVDIGPIADGHTDGAAETVTVDLGEVHIATAGIQQFTVTATGKNANNAGTAVSMVLDKIELINAEKGSLLAHSTITPTSSSIPYGGSTQVTMRLRGEYGLPLTGEGGTVTLIASEGAMGEAISNRDGTYTATWVAPTDEVPRTITISGMLDGEPLLATATIALRGVERGDTVLFEPEVLGIHDSSGRDSEVQNSASYSGGALLLYRAVGINDFVTFPINVPRAGTYSISVLAMTNSTNRPIASLSINGETQGGSLDMYSASQANTRYEQGNVTFDTAGEQLFTFTTVGRNLLSGGDFDKWLMFLDAIELTYVDHMASHANSTVAVSQPEAKSGEGVTITVQLRDEAGDPLVAGGVPVELTANRGHIGTVTDHENGVYTAEMFMPYSLGELEITATVNGQPLEEQAVVTVLPNESAGLPLAHAGSFATIIGEALYGTLSADSPIGEALTGSEGFRFELASAAANGVAELLDARTGQFVYHPGSAGTGNDAFTFRVTDGELESNTAEITIRVSDTWPPTWASGAFAGTTDVTNNSVTLNWVPATDDNSITEYEIRWSGGSLLVDGESRTATVEGLNSGTLYTFEITAIDAQGNRSGTLTVRASTQGVPATGGPPIYAGGPGQNEESEQGEEPGDDGSAEEPNSNGEDNTSTVKLADIKGHWAGTAIEQAVRLGIVNGFDDGTFRPDEPVRRAQLALMFSRALKLGESDATGQDSAFVDAAGIPAWARAAVIQAARAGIVAGYDDGSFRPDRQVSRVELAVMLARALNLPVGNRPAPDISDMADVPQWGLPYVAAVYEEGLLQGRGDGRFAPQDIATRAEVAVIMVRMLSIADKLSFN